MRIVQISDSHISCEHPSRAAELAACIDFINAMDPKPDVVVHTGDVAHNGLPEEYDIAKQALDRLVAPYFVLAGNRDRRPPLIEAFADGRHLRSDMEFVQYSVESFAARMIVVDTMCEESNKGELCPRRLEHIDRMLATDDDRPVTMFLHHPPFDVTVAPDPFQFTSRSEVDDLMAMLARHRNVIGLYCGHIHRDFETTASKLQLSVISSLASDVRWDRPDYRLPVVKTHVIPTTVCAEPLQI